MSSDLTGGTPADWIVCGWFTPDYRPLAEAFAVNLTEHGAPYHLWARQKVKRGWNTWAKPSVVLDAMRTYPGRAIVLMDVDCHVRGDLRSLAAIPSDVAFKIKARPLRLLSHPMTKRPVVKASSQIVVFRPTDAAKAFAEEWARLCPLSHYGGDENALAQTFLSHAGASFSYLPPSTSELVGHVSAHEQDKSWSLAEALRSIERRWLRAGRNQAAIKAYMGARD